jgi:ABC-type transport system involved in multi-copper enzyme maturation permease subunit
VQPLAAPANYNTQKESTMNITALTSTDQQTRAIQRPRLLTRVMTWELRRFLASRLFWFQALGFWGFLLLIIWALHASGQIGTVAGSVQLSAYVAGTSAGGLLRTLPTYLIILALLLPFITADGVTRDVNRRTHELLMTTALPTWAYVLGRYLASLIIGLGLALLLFASILGMGGLLHLTDSTYPLPQPDVVLLLWVGMVLSATILVSSVGFAMSTLWPRLSMLIKAVIMVGWLIGALVIPLSFRDATSLPGWYVDWDPTSGITALGLLSAYHIGLNSSITNEAQLLQFILSVENKMPDLAGWFVPHLLLAGLSLGLVLVAALAFKRSCETLS